VWTAKQVKKINENFQSQKASPRQQKDLSMTRKAEKNFSTILQGNDYPSPREVRT